MERVVGQRLAVLLVGGEREEVDEAIGDVRRPCIVGWSESARDITANRRPTLTPSFVLQAIMPIPDSDG